MIDRMIGAVRFDPRVYEALEDDRSATRQAAFVVIIVALFEGVGSAISLKLSGVSGEIPGGVVSVVALQVVRALIGWGLWALITYTVGTTIFNGTADWGELLRVLGFAQIPGVLNFFAFIPYLGVLIFALVGFWQLLAGLIGVRQALDFATRNAIFTIAIGWIIQFVLRISIITGSAGLLGMFG